MWIRYWHFINILQELWLKYNCQVKKSSSDPLKSTPTHGLQQ